jgi:hypothetical protein
MANHNFNLKYIIIFLVNDYIIFNKKIKKMCQNQICFDTLISKLQNNILY